VSAEDLTFAANALRQAILLGALLTAAELLGMTLPRLRQGIAAGAIVAVSTGVGWRVSREELIAAAMRMWEQGSIEGALGVDAAQVLPEAFRPVNLIAELRARVPRY
jgi:hypothetical protein